MSKDVRADVPAAATNPPTLGTEPDAASLRRMIATVVHDLNNPLSIIAGNAQLLGEIVSSMDLGGEIKDPLRDIERAVEEMTVQLERLSAVNRTPKGPSAE